MKLRRPLPKVGSWGAAFAVVAGAGLAGATLYPSVPAQAAPKLEIWPATRVLLLLPLRTSTNWNQDASLGAAIIPLVRPELQRALKSTGKFAITVPYRFDPIIQRALTDKAIPDDSVKALLDTPTLATGQAVFGQLHFEQPSMIADVQLEELRLGGTPASPTVQLVVSSKLFQAGDATPFTAPFQVTSAPVSGGSPEDRIIRAARDVFQQVAAQFVTPPPSFALPGPKVVLPVATPKPKPKATPAPVPVPQVITPLPPSTVQVLPPNSISPSPGSDFIPNLPPAQPPLGITVPNEPVMGR